MVFDPHVPESAAESTIVGQIRKILRDPLHIISVRSGDRQINTKMNDAFYGQITHYCGPGRRYGYPSDFFRHWAAVGLMYEGTLDGGDVEVAMSKDPVAAWIRTDDKKAQLEAIEKSVEALKELIRKSKGKFRDELSLELQNLMWMAEDRGYADLALEIRVTIARYENS